MSPLILHKRFGNLLALSAVVITISLPTVPAMATRLDLEINVDVGASVFSERVSDFVDPPVECWFRF